MRASLLLISSLVIWLPAPASAEPDCQAIVAATVAEMKAGAEDWDSQSEALVRRSAGAACVKALSGAYGTPLAAPASAPGAGAAPRAADSTPPAASTGAEEVAEQEDEGLFSGFKRNEISGSPSKKPYRRKREPEETDAEEAPTE